MFLPFRNVTRRAEHEWLVTGAPIMLGQALGQFDELQVVSDERLSAARRRLRISDATVPDETQTRRLAEETGGWTAVTGTVVATGPNVRVSLVATDVPTSRVIARAEQAVDSSADFRAAFDALSVRLLEPAGIPATGATLIALTTRSIEAYRAYLRGLAHYHRSEYRDAFTAFSEAVRLDSTFALGWSNLGLVAGTARGFQEMLDPRSMVYQALERATRNASRLPRDKAALIRAMQSFGRAQIAEARRVADSLVAAEPDNVGAVEIAAILYNFTIFFSHSPATMTADVNRAVRLGIRVLELDPGRRMTYGVQLLVYGMAGGLFWGETWADTRQFTSLPFMLMAVSSNPQSRFVPLLGDSVYFVPADTFFALPHTQQQGLRRRGADRAMEWARQWLSAGPGDSDAHLWTSRIAELQGNYALALRELLIADSIGIQTGIENTVARRMSLLLLTGNHEAAGAMADSLLRAGAMALPIMIPATDRRWNYGAAALLLTRRFASAGRLAELVNARRRRERACEALGYELAVVDPLPRAVRTAVMNAVRMHVDEFKAVPQLASCEAAFTTGLNDPP